MSKRILSGVQSSGQLHLGNYYGAIRQFVELQGQGEALYFIANLHALTTVKDAKLARQLTFETACAFIALGVDPEKSVLFRQSDIPEITELFWILGTVVPVANLELAHSYKDKVAKGIAPDWGLFSYPVLMAVDILLYGSDLVPVGKDQVQHLEFARDWAGKFNLQYAPKWNSQTGEGGILKLPSPMVVANAAVVPGTDGQKMSKSYNNTITLFGDEKSVEKAIKGIKTDSVAPEAPKPTTGSALYDLLKLMVPASEWENDWLAGGKGYGYFKTEVLFPAYQAQFGAARKRYAELTADPAEVERILKKGAEKARAIAAPTIKAVRDAVGL